MTELVGYQETFELSTDDWYLHAQRFLLANGITDDSKHLHLELLLALISNSMSKLLNNLAAPQKPRRTELQSNLLRVREAFPLKLQRNFVFIIVNNEVKMKQS